MDTNAVPNSPESVNEIDKKIIIPVHEEEISIDKVKVETGQVIIEKDVIDEQVTKEISLKKNQVGVTHVPKNQEVTAVPQVRREGNVTIIPVVKEVVVVSKKLVLIEEIHIEQQISTEVEEVKATVRKERVTIQRK